MRWIYGGALLGLIAAIAGIALSFSVERRPAATLYDRSSPEALLASTWEAIDEGDAPAIARFIWAENDDERLVLNEGGRLLGHLQELAAALQQRFPRDVQALRDEMAGAGPGMRGLLGSARDAARGSRDGTGNPTRTDPGFSAATQRIFADPLGWLERSKDRVTTVMIAQDMAAVLVDGKPALGVGMTMRYTDGQWWFDLPIRAPMVRRYVPQTPEEHMVLASMLRVVDNAVVEVTDDVRSGRARSLDEAASLAGEKAFPPMMLCFVAYQRVMEARNQ